MSDDASGPDSTAPPAASVPRARLVEVMPEAAEAFEQELRALARSLPERIDADPEHIESGLARLVLTLIELLRNVMEHQAVRRMEGGSLSDEEVERLGLALLTLSERMDELKRLFRLTDDDLNIDLGPLGRLR